MKTTSILLSALLLGTVGCTSSIPEEQIEHETDKYSVQFKGGISLTQTKAASTSDIGSGVKATIYAYVSGQTDASVASHEYEAGSNGNLTGTDSYTMQLGKGTYDFYGVSANSSTTSAPDFDQNSNTTTSALSNNVDYLWVKAAGKPITSSSSDQNIDLTFERKAVKIAITIKSGAGIQLTGWDGMTDGSGSANANAATITPPEATNCVMTLSTGAIAQSTSLNTTAANMTTGTIEDDTENNSKKKTTVSYIMLPLGKKDGTTPSPTVTLKVKVKVGTQTSEELRTYTADLKAPSGTDDEFKSGNQYNYTATLNANGITFTGAKVTDWEAQTGDELTPTEPDPE